MIIPLGLPLLTSSSGLPGKFSGRAALFPYLTLLHVEIARFTPRRVRLTARHVEVSSL